jgi:CheY-like chemotaxis protein
LGHLTKPPSEDHIDRSSFDQHVHDALGRLYDFPFLDASPLCDALGLRRRGEGGIALHRLLIDAIEQLKPSRDVAAESAVWKSYRSLHLRYVRALSASAAARELGLSARQAQRIQTLAVGSVAALLREAYRPWPATEISPNHPSGTGLAREVGPDLVLDEELAAILGDDQPDPEPFLTILRGAIETVRPMLVARRASVDLSADDGLDSRIGPRHLVRPAVVQLLLAAIDRSELGTVRVAATARGASVALAIDLGVVGVPGPHEESFERRLRVARTLLKGIGAEVRLDLDPPTRILADLPLGFAPAVLVVEDNPQVAQLLGRYLSGSPYRLLTASNGVAGFEVAKATKPAAITLDLLMPQSDGWELLQALKVHPETRDIPVIVCSVLRERELALALGATDFLAKPVTQHSFVGALDRIVLAALPCQVGDNTG